MRVGDVTIRRAEGDDLVAVMRVVDGALLSVGVDAVRDAIADGAVLLAVDGSSDRVVGALVRAGSHVEAVAVRRDRRRSGIGRRLVEAAAADLAGGDALTADFDPDVRGFYDALGFAVEERGGRLRGRLDGARD